MDRGKNTDEKFLIFPTTSSTGSVVKTAAGVGNGMFKLRNNLEKFRKKSGLELTIHIRHSMMHISAKEIANLSYDKVHLPEDKFGMGGY